MRNAHLKTVRKLWKEYVANLSISSTLRSTVYSSARIFFGRSAVMAKGLGVSPEQEHREGIHKLATVR